MKNPGSNLCSGQQISDHLYGKDSSYLYANFCNMYGALGYFGIIQAILIDHLRLRWAFRFSPLFEHLISIQYIYYDSNKITQKIIGYIKSIDLRQFLPSTHRFLHKTRPAAPGKSTSIYCTIHTILHYIVPHYTTLSYPIYTIPS